MAGVFSGIEAAALQGLERGGRLGHRRAARILQGCILVSGKNERNVVLVGALRLLSLRQILRLDQSSSPFLTLQVLIRHPFPSGKCSVAGMFL